LRLGHNNLGLVHDDLADLQAAEQEFLSAIEIQSPLASQT
jgi:hypothetical protein